jgi:hypothetical protein
MEIAKKVRLLDEKEVDDLFFNCSFKEETKGKNKSLSKESIMELKKNNISIGFDSCSAAKAFNFIEKNPQYEYMKTYIEPCEAGGKYSSYINVNSDYFPCSFAEGTGDWINGISVSNSTDFMKDVWFNEKTKQFGEGVKNCRLCNIGCSIYDI